MTLDTSNNKNLPKNCIPDKYQITNINTVKIYIFIVVPWFTENAVQHQFRMSLTREIITIAWILFSIIFFIHVRYRLFFTFWLFFPLQPPSVLWRLFSIHLSSKSCFCRFLSLLRWQFGPLSHYGGRMLDRWVKVRWLLFIVYFVAVKWMDEMFFKRQEGLGMKLECEKVTWRLILMCSVLLDRELTKELNGKLE